MLYVFFVFAASREIGVHVFGFYGLEGNRGICFVFVASWELGVHVFCFYGPERTRGISFLFLWLRGRYRPDGDRYGLVGNRGICFLFYMVLVVMASGK